MTVFAVVWTFCVVAPTVVTAVVSTVVVAASIKSKEPKRNLLMDIHRRVKRPLIRKAK